MWKKGPEGHKNVAKHTGTVYQWGEAVSVERRLNGSQKNPPLQV